VFAGKEIVRINADWWEHLAPKPLQRRLREVEKLLDDWCRTPYGANWLGSALRENGLIRVRPGQSIPVMQLIALGECPKYIAQMNARVGHRAIGPDHFGSGSRWRKMSSPSSRRTRSTE
jgi:hypothetical protein